MRKLSIQITRAVAFACFCIGVGYAHNAHAQSAADKAAAEALFDEGRALLARGDLAPACKKLEQSQAIDPGVGTLLYLAECYERSGRTASAWATFREAASAAEASGQAERAETGKKRAAALEARLSRLSLRVAEQEHADSFQVLVDGKALTPALWSMAFPVDPGTHSVSARADGSRPWSSQVVVADGALVDLAIPALEPEPVVTAGEEESAPGSQSESAQGAEQPAAGNAGRGQRIAGIVTGSAGLIALGVGVGFGIDAQSKLDQGNALCNETSGCSGGADASNALATQAQDSALVANVLYAAGGAAVLAGVIVYLTADDGEKDPAGNAWNLLPLVGPSSAALSLKGSF